MKNITIALFAFLFCNVNLQGQSNGIVIKAEYRSTAKCSSDSSINKITYYIRGDILRIDIRGNAANSSIIFQPLSSKVWVLYQHEQVYFSMDKSELDFLEEEIMRESADFENRIANMDSISKAENLSVWPAGNPFMFEDPEYKIVNKKDTLISQLMCDKYTGILNNGNVQMMYSNNFKTTGIKDDELKILNEFSIFMGKGVKALSGNMDFANIYKKEVGSYPILTEIFSGNTLCNQYWLKFVYRSKIENKLFEIPIAFGKIENPLGNK